METLLLVDGNAIIHRAFHAMPPLTTKSGVPTNVLYGFISMIHKSVIDFKPTHIIICFDTPKPTFRQKVFKEYQAHRPEMDKGLKVQIPSVKEALDKAGIFRLEKDGYEADDLIGTITHHFKNNGIKVLILSGDRDIFQLIDNNVFVVVPQNGLSTTKIYDVDEVQKKLGVLPQQIPDFKGLMGDPSDNYPGARGIGPKTAALLIHQFSTINNLYANLDKVTNPRLKQILIDNKENVLMSKKLATIITDVGVDFNIEASAFSRFKEDLKDYLLQFEVHSLAKRIFEEKKDTKTKKPSSHPKNQMGLF